MESPASQRINDGLRAYFDEHGYVVVDGLIPHERVDRVLAALEQHKRRRTPYYAQSVHNWVAPDIDDHGYMQESMENFTRLAFSRPLARAGNDILLSREVERMLAVLKPEFRHFCLWQNMLFDRSTGTVDHQDSWYLDTRPKGHLVAAWFALEDIHPDCGAFHVYPGSHRMIDPYALAHLSHDAFVAHCAAVAASIPRRPALLKKGSVLFWHPWTLHGAASQQDPSRSRKSLTAHYFPIGLARANHGTTGHDTDALALAHAVGRDLSRLRRIGALPIPVGYSRSSQIRFNAMGLARYAMNRIAGRYAVSRDMRRGSYR